MDVVKSVSERDFAIQHYILERTPSIMISCVFQSAESQESLNLYYYAIDFEYGGAICTSIAQSIAVTRRKRQSQRGLFD